MLTAGKRDSGGDRGACPRPHARRGRVSARRGARDPGRGDEGAAWLTRRQHYFTADPAVPFKREPLRVSVWGQELSLVSGIGRLRPRPPGLRHCGPVPRDDAPCRRSDPRPRLRLRRDRPGHRLGRPLGGGDRGGRQRAGGAAGQRERRLAGSGRPVRGLGARPRSTPRRRTTRSGPIRRSGSARRPSTTCCCAGCHGWSLVAARSWSSGKNLGADSLQRWLGEQGWPTARLASAKGFRVLETRADASLVDRLDALGPGLLQGVEHVLEDLRRVAFPAHDLGQDPQRLAGAVGPGDVAGKLLVGEVGVVLEVPVGSTR